MDPDQTRRITMQLPISRSATELATFATVAADVRATNYNFELPRPGDRLGQYDIVGVIATGGMSTIFEARHAYIGHRVALKTVLRTNHNSDAGERFLRE